MCLMSLLETSRQQSQDLQVRIAHSVMKSVGVSSLQGLLTVLQNTHLTSPSGVACMTAEACFRADHAGLQADQ